MAGYYESFAEPQKQTKSTQGQRYNEHQSAVHCKDRRLSVLQRHVMGVPLKVQRLHIKQ